MRTIKKASIVIPTYNRADYLDLTLQSIKKQVTVYDTETIVVDDGSADHTANVVRKYQKQFDIKYLFQEDMGNRTGAARNLGISNASGGIIIFVDSGVMLKSNCIHEHITIHDNSPQEVAVIGYVYGFDQYCSDIEALRTYIDARDVDGSIDKLNALGLFKDMREKLYIEKGFQINEMPAPWAMFITCNCSVKRSTLDKVGHFDTKLDLNWGVEDLELGYRLWKHQVKFVVGTSPASIHYPHEGDMKQKFEEEKINKAYFHKKHNAIATKVFLDCSFLELNERIPENDAAVSLG